jgi:hypothetical protein
MGAGAVAAATIGSAVIGAGASMMSANKAAGAAKDAAGLQQQMYEQTRGDLQPYNETGQNALQAAYGVAQRGPTGGGPDYVSMAAQNLPGNMTQAQLEATPGYQFTLAQGLKSTQSAAAARGLGVSGAALKGAATYATGLADSTYANRFNEAQQRFTDFVNLNQGQQGNITNEFNRYNALATLGQAAAAGTAAAGVNTAKAEGAFLNSAGQTQAGGMMGATNALSGGVNNYLGYQNAQRYGPQSVTTGGYGTAASGTPGISASGNPVMSGFAPSVTEAQIRGGYYG